MFASRAARGAARFKARQLAALVATKLDDTLTYALDADPLFDVASASSLPMPLFLSMRKSMLNTRNDLQPALVAPRLTHLCEFEDKQLEAHYKRDTVRDVLESRTTHIAVAMALASLGSAAMNWAAGAEDFVLPAFALACAGCCWLACAGYVHLAASQCMCCVAASMLVSATLPAGHSVIPMQQLFIAAFAAAYAQLDFPLLSRFERAERLYVLAALALLECMMIFVSAYRICLNLPAQPA
ncbi:hypothetical protein T492DRAFT_872987 [Pavlovales sp. CCMP2436]|nr:hypothetical protein T492DRAFT_872987 [Pavlovales sp. CCMP2436]